MCAVLTEGYRCTWHLETCEVPAWRLIEQLQQRFLHPTVAAGSLHLAHTVLQAAFIQGVLLNPQAPITLLAPLNSAFDAFLHDAGLTLDQLLANPSLLKQVGFGPAAPYCLTLVDSHRPAV